ncbi:MAG: PhzF family phenazine biosynthesis isomerase [Desulfovibrio sp.]|nr:PhzF family phenazine biosynthesis isomerase [Desulfovibrio sp.]
MRYYVVDAFADKVFEGNPAGVCIMEKWLSDDLMQKITMENNLSETAFAVKEGKSYHLRWFTPGGEIDLCGHATLATAYIIMRFVESDSESVSFNTLSGELGVLKKMTSMKWIFLRTLWNRLQLPTSWNRSLA